MQTVNFTAEALIDLAYWQKSGNAIILKRIRQLLAAIQENPYTGIGKPEALKHQLSGYWSRRINQEHRLVYEVEQGIITVISMRYHYPQ